jgi:hypothetical protein
MSSITVGKKLLICASGLLGLLVVLSWLALSGSRVSDQNAVDSRQSGDLIAQKVRLKTNVLNMRGAQRSIVLYSYAKDDRALPPLGKYT